MPESAQLSTADWGTIGNALKFLWLALVFAIISGTSLMTAHAFIPSAVATKTISARFEKLRMPLYATGVLTAILIFVMIALAATQADDIVRRLHPTYWQ